MQTFLPSPHFKLSAMYLDRQRLGKQRLECHQLLRALRGETTGWVNHPATKMWRGFEASLAEYGLAVCGEWVRRGYADSLAAKITAMGHKIPAVPPPWLGDGRLHSSHRSNLLRKFPDHYGRFGWEEPSDLPYYWPV